jgi:hypothetical protein
MKRTLASAPPSFSEPSKYIFQCSRVIIDAVGSQSTQPQNQPMLDIWWPCEEWNWCDGLLTQLPTWICVLWHHDCIGYHQVASRLPPKFCVHQSNDTAWGIWSIRHRVSFGHAGSGPYILTILHWCSMLTAVPYMRDLALPVRLLFCCVDHIGSCNIV